MSARKLFFASAFWVLPLLGQQTAAPVPFVGCKADGQVGPIVAPSGKDPALPITARDAQKLAYYSAGELGVLAPRGWYCFRTYGSGGESLFVGPQPIEASKLFSTSRTGFSGPVIELRKAYGGTSGRFEVAEMIARVFPAHKAFVTRVTEEGILDTPPSFPTGPYPKDELTYKSTEIVEYTTPAQTVGLGTNSSLQKNDRPIRGVAILEGEAPDLLLLSVRLPPDAPDITSTIVRQVERDAVSHR